MQKKKFVLGGIILCLLIVIAASFYWYQKPRISLSDKKPADTLNAKDLYTAYQQDETKANEQFLGKVVQVKGTVDNVLQTDSTVSLLLSSNNDMGGVNCSMAKNKQNQPTLPVKGAAIEVKGRCIGFLMDVNLADAVIVP